MSQDQQVPSGKTLYGRVPPLLSDNIAEPDSGGLFVILDTTTRRYVSRSTTSVTTVQYAQPMMRCNIAPADEYALIPASIAAICCLTGVVYCLFGYRFFKATMFLTGFLFGSIITYLICLEENLLPPEGKLGVSLGAGVLCGIITTLVRYVGVFLTGFHLGFLAAVGGLVSVEPFLSPPPTTNKWIPIGTVLGTGVLCALLALYAQKRVTIVATSMIGAAMVSVGVDYYLELHGALRLVVDRLKAEPVLISGACWVSWIVLGLTLSIAMVGLLVQWRVTAKGQNHINGASVQPRHKRNRRGDAESGVELPVVGPGSSQNQSKSRASPRKKTRVTAQSSFPLSSRYRHLYQIRRFNGDIVAQNYSFQVHGGNPQRNR